MPIRETDLCRSVMPAAELEALLDGVAVFGMLNEVLAQLLDAVGDLHE
ncbi:hypothetical protein ACWDD9_41370 [Kitasatospora sp. NPDC001119]